MPATPRPCPGGARGRGSRRRRRAAAAGSARSRRAPGLPPEHREVVDARALPAPVDGHDDREADHDLGRCDHHREEGQDLPVQVPVKPAEAHERHVDRVTPEPDRQEDHEGVLAHQHADRADREQERGDDQERGDRGAHAASRSAPTAAAAASARVIARRLREASTTTAIDATIRSTEVTSNGKKYWRNRTRDRAAGLPRLCATVSKFSAPLVANPIPARIATISSTAIPTPSVTPMTRCPLRRSSSDSSRSTPSSMITNRNSTMIAPA